jgi:hypothetical protein
MMGYERHLRLVPEKHHRLYGESITTMLLTLAAVSTTNT